MNALLHDPHFRWPQMAGMLTGAIQNALIEIECGRADLAKATLQKALARAYEIEKQTFELKGEENGSSDE